MWFHRVLVVGAAGRRHGLAEVRALVAADLQRGTVVIPAATVTSGTLTAGQWNYVPLPVPVQLAIGSPYLACTGWVSVNGFPETANQFGNGGVYAAGITNGPLSAYSHTTGSNPTRIRRRRACSAPARPTRPRACPSWATATAVISGWTSRSPTRRPAGYSGTYRLWPDKWDANPSTSGDAAVNYVVSTEVHLTQPCTLNNAWYYSPGGTTQLATRASVWSVTGAASGTEAAAITSPSWSGAAGAGWVSAAFPPGTTLPAGSYKVAVYNGAATPVSWVA